MVLFGGYDGSYLGDTWMWNGTTWTAHLVPPASAKGHEPSPRDTGSFVFDAATGTGVLFGGFDGVTSFTDTWTWSGFDWTQQNPATSPSDPTFGWMAAYDAVSEQVLLFGGNDGQTWTWNGVTWTKQLFGPPPPGRGIGSMTDDTATSHDLLFGGQSGHGTLSDLWAWNGGTWQQNH